MCLDVSTKQTMFSFLFRLEFSVETNTKYTTTFLQAMANFCKLQPHLSLFQILLCSIGNSGDAEATSLFLPDISVDLAALLLEVIYSGSVEACLGELRDLILLARALRVDIPVSEDLLDLLEIPPPESAQHEEEEEEEEEEDKKSSPPPAKSTGLGENHLPLPPPLKRIKEEVGKRNSPPPPPSSSSSSSDPLGYQDPLYQHPALQPGVKGGVGVGGYLCPFCNSKYDNAVAFKNHLKFHESEALKEQRTQMMNEMVATCFSESGKCSVLINRVRS